MVPSQQLLLLLHSPKLGEYRPLLVLAHDRIPALYLGEPGPRGVLNFAAQPSRDIALPLPQSFG